jgi:V8-like Glu-specific endopeptidase
MHHHCQQKINMNAIVISIVCILMSIQANAQDVMAQADQSVVRVVAKDRAGYELGSGFVVAKDIVATNYHVIENNLGVVVLKKNPSGSDIKPVKASVLWRSVDLDLALLEVPGLELPVITVRQSMPAKGNSVTTMGYPGAADEALNDLSKVSLVESTFTQGIIGRMIEASWSANADKQMIIQHSASVNSGNSGGPLLDNCGRVIGVNTAKALGIVQGDNRSGMTVNQSDGIFYASHISSLIEAMKQQGVPFKVTSEECATQTTAINPKLEVNIGSPKKSDNTKLIGLAAAAVLLAGGALFFSLRKVPVVRESYTQFRRRSGAPVVDQTKLSAAKNFRCTFVGQDSSGNPVNLNFSEKALRQGLVLGRDPNESDTQINDNSVSRRHAKLQYDSGLLKIRDLGSTNGTWVNGVRLGPESTALKVGQSFHLGKVSLRVEGELS